MYLKYNRRAYGVPEIIVTIIGMYALYLLNAFL